ncbi:MAG: hypothetical protein MJZ00_05280 [Paludibacteraceae bacterium]|nr:hypothetical protein [Paludibacteraceae bacterium]
MAKFTKKYESETRVEPRDQFLNEFAEAVSKISEIMETTKPIGQEQRVMISDSLGETQKEKIREYTEKLGGEYIPKAEYGMSSVRFAEDSLANPKVCVSLVMGEKPEVVAQTIKETRTEKSQKAETSVKNEEKRNSQSQKSVKKQFPQKKKGVSK